MNSKTKITIQVPLEIARYYAKIKPNDRANIENKWLFGLCYAMDGGYKGCNPYIERHLAIFVNCF
ncbi:MAG: hypothetical protein IM470_00580 [Microcystis sp. M158S2]|nr:hypothetical protein [Microcystis sp. M158S2]